MNDKELLEQLKINLKNYLDDYNDKLRNGDKVKLEELDKMQKEIEEIRDILIENWGKLFRRISLLMIQKEI